MPEGWAPGSDAESQFRWRAIMGAALRGKRIGRDKLSYSVATCCGVPRETRRVSGGRRSWQVRIGPRKPEITSNSAPGQRTRSRPLPDRGNSVRSESLFRVAWYVQRRDRAGTTE